MLQNKKLKKKILQISLLLIIVLGYFFQFSKYCSNYLYGFDHYGYYDNAKSIEKYGFGKGAGSDTVIPFFTKEMLRRHLMSVSKQFDFGFFLAPPASWVKDFSIGDLVNQYPFGFPLLLLITGLNEPAIYWLNPILLVLFLIILFFYFQKDYFIEYIFLVICFLFLPVFFNSNLLLTSDISSLLVIISVLIVYNYSKELTDDRIFLLFSGLLSGFSLLFRYPNVILIIIILIMLWSDKIFYPTPWTQVFIETFYFIFGTLLGGVLPLFIYEYSLYGFSFKFPYQYYDPLSFRYFIFGFKTYFFYPFQQYSLLALIVVIFAIVGWVNLFKKKGIAKRIALESLFIVTGYTFLYSCYTTENFDPRYLLPVWASIIFLSVSGVSFSFLKLNYNSGIAKSVFFSVFAIVILLFSPHNYHKAEQTNRYVFQTLQEETEANAIIFASGWSGTIRHYCDRQSYRWLWTSKEVLDSAVEYFLKKEIPLYILIDHGGEIVDDYLNFLTKRYVIKQQFIHFSNQTFRFYKITNFAFNVGLKHGKIIPEGGNMIDFFDERAFWKGPHVAYDLVMFATKTLSHNKFISKQGIYIKGPWSGIQFRLKPDYHPLTKHCSVIIKYFDNKGDFLFQRISGENTISSEQISLKNSGKIRTHTCSFSIDKPTSFVIRIQNNSDEDKILLREIKILPVPEEIQNKYSIDKKELITKNLKKLSTINFLLNKPTNINEFKISMDSSSPRERASILLNILNQEKKEFVSVSPILLQYFIKDNYFLCRYYALLLIEKYSLFEQMKTDVLKCLHDDMAIVRRTAARILINNHDYTGIPVLKQDIKNTNYWEQTAAIKLLQTLKIPFKQNYKTIDGF